MTGGNGETTIEVLCSEMMNPVSYGSTYTFPNGVLFGLIDGIPLGIGIGFALTIILVKLKRPKYQ